MSDDITPEQLDAQHLHVLVTSPGWALFVQHVEQSWGAEAQLKRIDTAYKELKPGDTRGEKMTGLQILAAAKSVQQLVKWPAERVAMQQAVKPKSRLFEEFMRMTR